MGSSNTLKHPVLLFDGVCNLCNQSVLFIIKRDPAALFRFSALQSTFGSREVESHGLDPKALHSIVLLKDGKAYERSRAALEVARQMRGLWPLLYIFIIIPPFIRDWVYNLIAANRYKLFGKKDQCMIPTPELKSRFVD